MYGREPGVGRQKFVLALLGSQKEFAAYAFKTIAVIGRPSVLFEQSARLAWPVRQGPSGWNAWLHHCPHLLELVEFWKNMAGAHEVKLFADLSEKATSQGLSEGHRAALSCTGLDAVTSVPPNHFLELASHEGRHFFLLREVRNNAWPPLDEMNFLALLKEQREPWNTGALVSPRYRAALE